MQTSILIADAQRIVREGLREILTARSELHVVAEASDGEEAVEAARRERPDVALVETQLPRLPGVEVVRRIRSDCPGTRCIVLSAQDSASHVRLALLAGASGFVPKSATAAELLDAIRAARLGRSYLAPSIADHVVHGLRRQEQMPADPDGQLTRRQREVLRLIAEGMSTREIAVQLGISVKTAQTHRATLMNKVGVHKASGLVRYAIREGIVAA